MNAAAATTVPAPFAGAQDPDLQIYALLAGIEYDALTLASIAIGAEREARFGDDIPALRSAINTARLTVIAMVQAFNKLEAIASSGVSA
jgi:hypothetical protein